MAENGTPQRPPRNPTWTYPGTATRLLSSTTQITSTSTVSRTSGTSSVPAVFSRPLSRSQLSTTLSGSVGVSPSIGEICRPPSPPARPISLDQPRPNSERHRNLYLGAPLPVQNRGGTAIIVSGTPTTTSSAKVMRVNSGVTAADQVRLPSHSRKIQNGKESRLVSLTNSQDSVVTSQPTKEGLLDPSSELGKSTLAESSIICPYCRKCRCEACGTPRSLPSRWICSKSIHCGAEPLLDYVTCLCCVKAVFYHCGKNHEADGGVLCADKPCSCTPHRKFWRWGCMAGMSIILPCLCLYWPCKGCLCLVEKTYQRYHNNGCNCRQMHGSTTSRGDGSGVVETSEDEDTSNNRIPNAFLHPPPISHTGSIKLLSPPRTSSVK